VTDPGSIGYRLTEEQVLLRDTIRQLAFEQIAPRAAEIDRSGEFPEDIRQLLASQDVLALPYPAEHGGLGADLLTQCLAIEAIAHACVTSSLILSVQALASLPLLLGGSKDQHNRFFPDLASGKTLAAFALTEPEAGSDAAALRTRAVRDGDEYRITGTKRFITNGSVAGLITVFAVTKPEAKRHERISAFAVEVPAEGFKVARLEHKLGIRGSPTAELTFAFPRPT
jgi:alkylation response protein AidB-like acyl-CoA dehydrogenase